MNIVVPVKLVPDLVEELSIDESGTALDTSWLRLILNEFDDHAIEQAILLVERYGGQVVVVAPDVEGVDDVLYEAAAKGASRLIKLTGDFEIGLNNHTLARVLATTVTEFRPDLVLTGVQTHNDLDGSIGPLLAAYLEMPYVGYVASVATSDRRVIVSKEYPGGLTAEMEVMLPAVLGIQAAEEPPRYIAFSKIRQAMKTVTIEEQPVTGLDPAGGPVVRRMFQPEGGERATMIEGDVDEIATKFIDIFQGQGIL
jgi:electron transfer flavoprotein beta subunit